MLLQSGLQAGPTISSGGGCLVQTLQQSSSGRGAKSFGIGQLIICPGSIVESHGYIRAI